MDKCYGAFLVSGTMIENPDLLYNERKMYLTETVKR